MSTCKYYLMGKMSRKQFGKVTRVEFLIQVIHSNIYRPMNLRARHGVY